MPVAPHSTILYWDAKSLAKTACSGALSSMLQLISTFRESFAIDDAFLNYNYKSYYIMVTTLLLWLFAIFFLVI